MRKVKVEDNFKMQSQKSHCKGVCNLFDVHCIIFIIAGQDPKIKNDRISWKSNAPKLKIDIITHIDYYFKNTYVIL